jgi:5'(3')-deoxyribonucleotidase
MSEIIRPSIGLDLDTCLNNIEDHWLAQYNADYNDNITPENLLTWDTYKYVKPECGKKIYDYIERPGFFLNLDPKPYTQRVTKWLIEYADLYVVTAYTPNTCMDKAQWIKQYYSWIPVRNIMFVNDKSKILLDYLVDDGPHNVEVFKGKSILIDMVYNRYLGDKYTRVKDYLGVESFFKDEFQKLNLL